MDPAKLRGNVLARQAVDDLLEFVPDVLTTDTDRVRFWELLAEHAAAKCGAVLVPDEAPLTPMSEVEAKKFERTRVPYGQHAGHPVDGVPPDYWAAITTGDFRRKVIRYTRSAYYRIKHGLPRF